MSFYTWYYFVLNKKTKNSFLYCYSIFVFIQSSFSTTAAELDQNDDVIIMVRRIKEEKLENNK